MNLIFLGAPSSGKGTQAKRLAGEFDLAHLATGDILRQAIASGTALGLQAKPIMDRGDLVPDELVIGMVAAEIAQRQGGLLFDGFPRTEAQAVALDQMLAGLDRPLDLVVFFDVPEEALIKRATSRWLCSNRECQQPFNAPGICNKCGSELYQRADDNEQAVRNRLVEYHAKTEGLLGYYRNKGLLVEVDGTGSMDEVTQRIRDCVSQVAEGSA